MKLPNINMNSAHFFPFRHGFIAAGLSARLEDWLQEIVGGRKGNDQNRVRQDKRRLLETLSHFLHIFFWEACDYCRRFYPASC